MQLLLIGVRHWHRRARGVRDHTTTRRRGRGDGSERHLVDELLRVINVWDEIVGPPNAEVIVVVALEHSCRRTRSCGLGDDNDGRRANDPATNNITNACAIHQTRDAPPCVFMINSVIVEKSTYTKYERKCLQREPGAIASPSYFPTRLQPRLRIRSQARNDMTLCDTVCV